MSEVIRRSGNPRAILKILDLASLESVRKFAEDVNKTESRLDILINNAGKNLDTVQNERLLIVALLSKRLLIAYKTLIIL